MASNTSRNRGNGFERTCAQKLRSLGYIDVKCSRECSRLRDSKKVDLCNADEDESGRLPFNLQCKAYSTLLNYRLLIEELEHHNGDKLLNIVLHKYTEKSAKGKFMPKGEWAIMRDWQFLKFVGGHTPEVVHATVVKNQCVNYIKLFKKHPTLVILYHLSGDGGFIIVPMDYFWKLISNYKNG